MSEGLQFDVYWLLWISAKFPYIDFAINGRLNDAVVFWKCSFRRGHMGVIMIWIDNVVTVETNVYLF